MRSVDYRLVKVGWGGDLTEMVVRSPGVQGGRWVVSSESGMSHYSSLSLYRMVSVHSMLPVERDTLRWWMYWWKQELMYIRQQPRYVRKCCVCIQVKTYNSCLHSHDNNTVCFLQFVVITMQWYNSSKSKLVKKIGGPALLLVVLQHLLPTCLPCRFN